MNPITDRPWLDTELAPNERATNLVEAMTLEEKIEQLHGNMETIDIYALTNSDSKEMTAEEMEQLAAQIRFERHVVANEGADMARPLHPHDQAEMVSQLLGLGAKTVVVLKDSAPMTMPWIDETETVIEVWNQGVDEGEGYPTIRYTEGLNMGYRWCQSQGIKPLFEFGHGLSYTSFDISEIAVSATELAPDVSLTVTARAINTGDHDGAEVVQVYLGIPVDGQPPK